MTIEEKLILIAENQQKIYDAGYSKGYAQAVEDSKPGIFYINDFGREFKKGMTWEAWIDSTYNNTDASIGGDTVYINGLSAIYAEDGTMQRSYMTIIPNHYYYT